MIDGSSLTGILLQTPKTDWECSVGAVDQISMVRLSSLIIYKKYYRIKFQLNQCLAVIKNFHFDRREKKKTGVFT